MGDEMAKKILLVDDAQTVLLFEKMLLSSLGFQIETANNGQEALDKIKKWKPDLVLLDYMMPVMDGLTCCRMAKSDRTLKSIPIIMVTTISEQSKVNECFDAGCDDYIFKPFKKEEILQKIRKHLAI